LATNINEKRDLLAMLWVGVCGEGSSYKVFSWMGDLLGRIQPSLVGIETLRTQRIRITSARYEGKHVCDLMQSNLIRKKSFVADCDKSSIHSLIEFITNFEASFKLCKTFLVILNSNPFLPCNSITFHFTLPHQ
jgi:hypothetical protein